MPIRADNRKYYDSRWRKFRMTMLEAAGNVCERCGKPHRLLNVAHLNHDPRDRQFLAVLCPSCHAKNDTPQRIFKLVVSCSQLGCGPESFARAPAFDPVRGYAVCHIRNRR